MKVSKLLVFSPVVLSVAACPTGTAASPPLRKTSEIPHRNLDKNLDNVTIDIEYDENGYIPKGRRIFPDSNHPITIPAVLDASLVPAGDGGNGGRNLDYLGTLCNVFCVWVAYHGYVTYCCDFYHDEWCCSFAYC